MCSFSLVADDLNMQGEENLHKEFFAMLFMLEGILIQNMECLYTRALFLVQYGCTMQSPQVTSHKLEFFVL